MNIDLLNALTEIEDLADFCEFPAQKLALLRKFSDYLGFGLRFYTGKEEEWQCFSFDLADKIDLGEVCSLVSPVPGALHCSTRQSVKNLVNNVDCLILVRPYFSGHSHLADLVLLLKPTPTPSINEWSLFVDCLAERICSKFQYSLHLMHHPKDNPDHLLGFIHEVQALLNNGNRVDALPPGTPDCEKRQAELWFTDDKPVLEAFLRKLQLEFNLYAAFIIQHAGPGYYHQISIAAVNSDEEFPQPLNEMAEEILSHDPIHEKAIVSKETVHTGRGEFCVDSPDPFFFTCQAGGVTYGHLGVAVTGHQVHRHVNHRAKLIPMLANQLGLYFSHFYQLRKEAIHGRMLQQINQTCNTINFSVDTKAILSKLTESLNHLFGQYSGAILTFSRETDQLLISSHLGEDRPANLNLAELIVSPGPITEAINEGAAFDNRNGKYKLPIRYVLPLATTPQAVGVNTEFMPLRSMGGVVLFDSPANRRLSEEDLNKLMPILLNGISASLQVASNYAEKLETIKTLEVLISRLSNMENLLDDMIFIIRTLLKVNRISYLEVDETGSFLRIKKGYNLPAGILDKTRIPIGEEISGYVAQQGKSYRIDNIESEGVFKKRSQEHYLNASLLSVPLISNRRPSGHRVIGVINVNNKANGLTFTPQDQQLLEAIAHLVVTAIENVRLQQEESEKKTLDGQLSAAREIQMSLMPTDFSQIHENLDVFGQSIPARMIGGDFFDYYTLPDGRLLMVLGDVAGKGMPAAILMAITRMIIWSVVQNSSDPVQIIEKANEKLCTQLDPYHFVTMQIVAIDPQTGICEMTSAGHGPLLARLQSQCRLIESKSGPPLGIPSIKNGLYHKAPFTMQPGDAFTMYTDGLSEEKSPSGEMYGSERINLMLGSNPDMSAQQIVAAFIVSVEKWRGKAEAHDDLTIFTIRFKGPAQ
ncbi:MAG TPA: SpoIIE family protein phosphatase [Candidatus Rifleibacterium sp.]|nr:SpoIIE family protein phosphatase [Candidatus Rifleibacterium sp.]